MKQMRLIKVMLLGLIIAALFPTTVSANGTITINEGNFPDAAFRSWLLEQDYGTDGILTEEEINNVTTINFGNNDWEEGEIKDLKGIEFFTALTVLSCDYNQLSSLDISKNTALTYLSCNHNQLTSLDISKNTALTYLQCDNNQLTTLDVSKNTALKELSCNYNQLTSLDVSKNTTLGRLECWFNQLTSLDVTNNTELWRLICSDNQLTSLDVSMNTKLWWLLCGYNQITSLDVTKLTELQSLNCAANQLTSLDVSQNTALRQLECSENQLTTLDVSMNTLLGFLYCNETQLTSLDVTKLTELQILNCAANQLTSLDVSNNTALRGLGCSTNQLTSLDVSMNTLLDQVNCSRNKIRGAAMTAFIKSLPNADGSAYSHYFLVYNNSENDEGNICTTVQVAMAKEKGWTTYYIDPQTEYWEKYEGSEPATDKSILIQNRGYGTFYDSRSDYTLPEGYSAQVVTGYADGHLIYETIADGVASNVVPMGTPVMLTDANKQEGIRFITLTPTESTVTYTGDNLLRGTDVDAKTTGEGYHYKLMYSSQVEAFGWFWMKTDGAPFTIAENCAWLVLPESDEYDYGFTVDGMVLGIQEISDLPTALNVNDLHGRKMSNDRDLPKGIYIMNGKKVVKK